MKRDDGKPGSDVLAPLFADTDLPLFARVKMQAEVLVPVLRAFRAEFGKEQADQVATEALREWSAELYREIGSRVPGSPRRKWETINAAVMARIAGDGDMRVVNQSPDSYDFDVTRCRYAEFFRELEEPELGALLVCQMDHDIEAVGRPDVTVQRTQTLMKGASYCDFRIRMTTREDESTR